MKKQKNDSFKFIGIVLLAGVLMYFILTIDFNFKTFSIIPELDNRITYLDINNQGTEFVVTESYLTNPSKLSGAPAYEKISESDKWSCLTGDGADPHKMTINPCTGSNYGSGYVICTTQKDFSRLNIFIRAYTGGNFRAFLLLL